MKYVTTISYHSQACYTVRSKKPNVAYYKTAQLHWSDHVSFGHQRSTQVTWELVHPEVLPATQNVSSSLEEAEI